MCITTDINMKMFLQALDPPAIIWADSEVSWCYLTSDIF